MKKSIAHAQWNGKINDGSGTMKFTGYEGAYTFASRFENAGGTNPEELIGAALAGCYSMYLSLLLTEEGLNPEFSKQQLRYCLQADLQFYHSSNSVLVENNMLLILSSFLYIFDLQNFTLQISDAFSILLLYRLQVDLPLLLNTAM